MTIADRALVLAGGVAGALGVGLSAAAAHTGTGSILATAASFLLMHAPALLLTGFLRRGVMMRLGGFLLLAGLVLFSGDLTARAFLQTGLFPSAAPGGGILLICGWLVLALSAWARQTETPAVSARPPKP